MAGRYELLRADLAAKRDHLSPRLRDIADFALRNPNDMALETIAVIAERAGVPLSAGCWAIFGHGNVAGLGEAPY